MRGNAHKAGANTRELLLELARMPDAAQNAITLFKSHAVALLRNTRADNSSPIVLTLLSAAVERREPEWTRSLTKDRHAKRQCLGRKNKHDVVFAARMAQNLVKTYASTNGSAVKAGELKVLITSMDLACMALYIVCALEHTAKLGDLVVDNLLYQVAKKYAEMPDTLESAFCVAACVNIRLWTAHFELSDKKSSGTLSLLKITECLEKDAAAFGSRAVNDLKSLVNLPPPESFHTASFARLLLGHANTCISLLSSLKDYKSALVVAETTMSPWLSYFQQLSGENAKLASSFSDRAFRTMWKIAAAIDSAQATTNTSTDALQFRSVALSFLLKCSNYTSKYYIQQVHRVGVQHERLTKRSQQGLNEIFGLYCQSANLLSEYSPISTCIYNSECCQWEYIYWLEHFALICELSGMHVKCALVFEHAIQYVQLYTNVGRHIEFCLASSAASALLNAANLQKQDNNPFLWNSICGSAICTISKTAGRMIRDLHDKVITDEWISQCENVARVYLRRLEALLPLKVELLDANESPGLDLIIRLIKRSATKLFNYVVSAQCTAKYQRYSQVITSFDIMCKAINELSLAIAGSNNHIVKLMLVEQLRLNRMAVTLSARVFILDTLTTAESVLSELLGHIASVCKNLDSAIEQGKLNGSILNEIHADLYLITREGYSCASHCYKKGNHQEATLVLLKVLKLGKSYLEFVMQSDLNAEDKHKAHAEVKLDAVASLLVHCFRVLKDFTKARLFTGYTIMYCQDLVDCISQANVNTYIRCLLDEVKLIDDNAQESILNEFEAFLHDTSQVFKSRLVAEDQVMMLWMEFRDAFNQTSAKITLSLQGNEYSQSNNDISVSSLRCVKLFGLFEHHINEKLLKMKTESAGNKSSCKLLQNVSFALIRRNQIFSNCYAKRNVLDTVKELFLVYQSLSDAVNGLLELADALNGDLGGIYGWRGVITMEIALLVSYKGSSDKFLSKNNLPLGEENAVADIKRSLSYWGEKFSSGFLFDGLYLIQCLESMCNTLSLTSSAQQKMAACKLLKTLQLSKWSSNPILSILPLPLGLQAVDYPDTFFANEVNSTVSSNASFHNVMNLFGRVDRELFAAKTNQICTSKDRAYLLLLNAVVILSEIKQNVKNCWTATMAKAVGIRELLAHTILSDIHFSEGQSTFAISEAKCALRVCWKLVRKFTALTSPVEVTYFSLPPEIAVAEDQQRATSSFLRFMALDCSSWDLLLVTKVLLCRLSSLFSLSDQPHRYLLHSLAEFYLTEAMRLVGGLDLQFFRRSPFYEYAELELNANKLEKAKVSISLLNSNLNFERGAIVSCDPAIIEQSCDEIVQQGDVYLSEDKQQEALKCYTDAINMVDTLKDHQSFETKRLGRVKARCWRKYTRLQSQANTFSNHAAVETLLRSMKILKQSLNSCAVLLERVKCMLEVGRINVRLLQSVSTRAFTSLAQTQSILEEAYWLGSKLGISYLNHELRKALGMAYFTEFEEARQDNMDNKVGYKRATFLLWASSALLANGGSGDGIEKEPKCADRNGDGGIENTLKNKLKRRRGGSKVFKRLAPHQHLVQIAQNFAQKVQQLPDNWIIISLMIGLSSELVVTRIPTNGDVPTSFCLPKVIWMKCIDEMSGIVNKSRELLSGHTAEEARLWSNEQKKNWWGTRQHLNTRIDETIVSMQQSLGFWRCLFVGGPEIESEIVQRCWSLLTDKSSFIKLAERNYSLLCAIVNAQDYLSDSELVDGLQHIAAETEVPMSNAISRKILQILRCSRDGLPTKATHSNLTTLSTDKIAKMKLGEVKQLLAAQGINTDGVKKVLMKRLLAARDAALINEMKPQPRSVSVEKKLKFATILILDHQLQQFPWEGMDVMDLCAGVTRMPSLDMVVQNFASLAPVRRDRVRYLLNPAGDLKSTELQLGPILERGVATYGWEGMAGKVPDQNTIRDYLLAADVYIYCGHGSGEAYLHRDKVLDLKSNCSAALLFGCGSGRLEREGIFGPSGTVLSYLRAGSSAILAMLWDVTDRDVDQLSCKILEEWLLAHNEESLAQVLQTSRDVCKLKYLNGHAAVCYGLPLHVAQN
ncbi:putative SAP domain, peptidase C50, separase, SEPARIN core domain-containing protein [Plasmopara halstedii]